MTEETKLKQSVCKWLDLHNIYHIPYVPGILGVSGIPDRLLCINGNFIGIEFKSNSGKLSKIQEYQIEKIKLAGGTVFILNPKNKKEILNILEVLKNG